MSVRAVVLAVVVACSLAFSSVSQAAPAPSARPTPQASISTGGFIQWVVEHRDSIQTGGFIQWVIDRVNAR